jgi:Fe-S-cluster containining protein
MKGTGPYITGKVELNVAGRRLGLEMKVPAGPARPAALLPLYRKTADAVVQTAVDVAEANGEKISCAKGCGACCRQLVPISAIEARRLRLLIQNMPAGRRAVLRARFAAARVKLEQAGLLETLTEPREASDAQIQELGHAYFAQGIACPFLEDESCSIHPERPIACREYLVTSPPEHCAHPSAENISLVKMPAAVARTVRNLEPLEPTEAGRARWVPLIVAAEWADAHPDRSTPRPGTELAGEFFGQLRGRKL